MRIALIAAEAVPFYKVGGLADVTGALAVALARAQHEVTVFLPWYEGIDAASVGHTNYALGARAVRAPVGERRHAGVRFVFVGQARPLPRAYGGPDELRRFVEFALGVAPLVDADVLHAHDWQAALLIPLCHARRVAARRTVLTLHNLAFQGQCEIEQLAEWSKLPESYFALESMEFFGRANLLKGGIVYADRVTTVSPRYAQEIQGAEHGEGLDGVLRHHAGKVVGILNGIDVDYWDPSRDALLPAQYDSPDAPGKQRCRDGLRGQLGLKGPVLGMVSRLVSQKGVDIVREAVPELIGLGYSLAVLGAGEPHEEAALSDMARRHPGRVHVTIGYDEGLAHRIYAGADAFLMPSRYEPCGLAQMIAQRYGTPPIVRRTGGLADTVLHGSTGIVFDAPHADGLIAGVVRYGLHADKRGLAATAMRCDVSWGRSAIAYGRLFEELEGDSDGRTT